jgi:hypothetical protein
VEPGSGLACGFDSAAGSIWWGFEGLSEFLFSFDFFRNARPRCVRNFEQVDGGIVSGVN